MTAAARPVSSFEREAKHEAFRQNTLKTWEAYLSTGLHVTAEDADAWLVQLEVGKEVEPPPPIPAPATNHAE